MAPTPAPRTAPTPAPKTAPTPAPKTAPIQSIVHPPAAASAPGAVPVDIDSQNGNGHGDLIQLDEEAQNDNKKSAQSYLALTNLGMGKKNEENNNKTNKESPKDSKKSEGSKQNSNATNGNNTKEAGKLKSLNPFKGKM